jgi:hypothetical protein
MALCGFQLGGFNLGAGSALPNRARLLLNKVPGARIALSPAWQLSPTTTNGSRLRRDSDEAELDFTPAGLRGSAATAFADGASAFYASINDQSGNNHNAAQATKNAQARAINAGTLDTENGVPVVRFDGVDDLFSVAAGTMPTVLTISMPIRIRSFTSDARIYNLGTSSGSNLTTAASVGQNVTVDSFIRTTETSGRYRWDVPLNEFGILTQVFDTVNFTNTHAYWNGQLLTRTIATTPTGTFVVPTGNLFNIAGPTVFNPINLGEFLAWPSDQTANLSKIVADQARRFKVTLP